MNRPDPTMADHLLVKNGLYYRPNSAGYTPLKDEAGLYPRSRDCSASGVCAIHKTAAPRISPGCPDHLKADTIIKILRRQIEALGLDPEA